MKEKEKENNSDENKIKINTNIKKEEINKINNDEEQIFLYDKNKQIGKGSFGKIFIGIDKNTGNEIAKKFEIASDEEQSQLKNEYKIYKILEGGYGFPKAYNLYKGRKYNVLTMELLGPSLENIFNKKNKKFSLLTNIMIIEQILYRLEYLHSKGIVYRDIKPDNFLIGKNNKKNIIYMIDFGLSKKYKESKTGLLTPYRDGKYLTGTARYASINNHLGVELSRRDDIEALGYMMVYFMKGHLPWQGMINTSNPNKKYDKIKKLKIKIKLNELCQGLPEETIKFIQYARDMRFEDKPDYSYLRGLMRKIAANNGIKIDYNQFDWIIDEQNNDDE